MNAEDLYMPKVGEECEYHYGFNSQLIGIVEIKAITLQHVIFTEKGKGNEQVIGLSEHTKFRKIKSEREKVVEWTEATLRNEFGFDEPYTHTEMFEYLHKTGALTIPK